MAVELRTHRTPQQAAPWSRKNLRCTLVEAVQVCLLASRGRRNPLAVVHILHVLELGHGLHDLVGRSRLLPAQPRTDHNHHLWGGHSHHDRDNHSEASPLGLVSVGSRRKAWACHKHLEAG